MEAQTSRGSPTAGLCPGSDPMAPLRHDAQEPSQVSGHGLHLHTQGLPFLNGPHVIPRATLAGNNLASPGLRNPPPAILVNRKAFLDGCRHMTTSYCPAWLASDTKIGRPAQPAGAPAVAGQPPPVTRRAYPDLHGSAQSRHPKPSVPAAHWTVVRTPVKIPRGVHHASLYLMGDLSLALTGYPPPVLIYGVW